MMYCECKEWITNMSFIYLAEGFMMGKGFYYEGSKFTYCPFCGKKLLDNKEPYMGRLI